MNVQLMLTISVVAFLAAAFFAGAETAFLATDRIRLRHLVRKGDRRARLLARYVANPEQFLSIVLVGTNLGVIGCTSTFTALMIHYFGDQGATIATAILVPTLLVFEEIIPKGLFLYYADRASVFSAIPLRVVEVVGYPVIWFFSATTRLLAKLFGVKTIDRKVQMTMEELLFHLRGSQKAGLIPTDTMALASRAYELLNNRAGDISIPIRKVVALEDGLSMAEYADVIGRERFSRFPIYRGAKSNFVGILSVQRFFEARHTGRENVELEPTYIVDVETPITQVLIEMKNQGRHMALLRDNSGVIVGMATLEDILERLVGTIADEFH